jgi:DHA3 family tetracycline resistance protein-like MFS transporter
MLRRRIQPFTLYLILCFSADFLFWLIFTIDSVYHVTVVKLTPFQLVIVGTILEASTFAFEIPTGILADVKSRRLSIIIGYVVMGIGFVIEGSLPFFWAVALAQVVWGLGYTFTSGATQAWIVDEVGDERATQAFLRGSQIARIGSLVAIPFSVLLGLVAVALPVVTGGALMILLAGFLALTMSEAGFQPTPPAERTTWGMMLKTAQDARQLTRRQPILLTLLGIMFFYGLYSEGLDRLWTAHVLENFTVPWLDVLKPAVWFGAIRAVDALGGIAATEIVRRRADTRRADGLTRFLMLNAGLTVAALAGFALVRNFWGALALFWTLGMLRAVVDPLYNAWFNQRIDDSQVRATMFSVTSQMNAIGQVVGGPAVGAIGNRSIRAALVASALLLSPVLPLYEVVRRRRDAETRRHGDTKEIR